MNSLLASSRLYNGLFWPKEIGLFIASALVCTLALIKMIIKKRSVHIKINWIDIFVMCYLFLIPLLHLALFEHLSNSALSSYWAYGCIYLSIRVITTDIRRPILANVITEITITVLCIQLLVGLLQITNIIPSHSAISSFSGMFSNSAPYAIYIAALIGFAFFIFIIHLSIKRWELIVVYGIILIIGICFIALSLSRAAWIGLFIAFVVPSAIIITIRWRNRIKILKASILIILIGLIPAAILSYQIKQESADGRILIWKTSLRMMGDHLLTGIGINNFAPNYIYYQASILSENHKIYDRYSNLAGESNFAFNDILHTGVEMGLGGFIILTSIMCLAILSQTIGLNRFYRHKWALVLFGSQTSTLLVIITSGMFFYSLYIIPIGILFWFNMASISTQYTLKNYFIPKQNVSLFPFLGIMCFGAVYFISLGTKTIKDYSVLTIIADEYSNKNTEEILLHYQSLKNNPTYLYNLADSYVKKEKYGEALPHLLRASQLTQNREIYYQIGLCYEKLGNYIAAKKAYILIKNAMPSLIKPRYLLAMIEYNLGNTDSFKMMANDVLQFKPKVINNETERIKRELRILLRQTQSQVNL